MTFFQGLIETIRKGALIIDIDTEKEKSYIVWHNILSVILYFPVLVYLILIVISPYKYSFIEYITFFKDAYIGLAFFSMIFRVFGVSYLGTYKYIFNYIFKKN